VQKVAQSVFPEPEYRVYPFEDGPSLLDALETVRPDAVLVSLALAAPGGGEIARALRSREGCQGLPVIGLRGTFEPADLERIQEGDYDRVFRKPFDSERLAASVREFIARKTGPSTMPEEPVWPAPGGTGEAGVPEPQETTPGAAGEVPASGPPGVPDPGLLEWIRREIINLEREIEKRVRAGLLAELREWMSRKDRGAGPGE
jgi:CheY-like chemotaxis protein